MYKSVDPNVLTVRMSRATDVIINKFGGGYHTIIDRNKKQNYEALTLNHAENVYNADDKRIVHLNDPAETTDAANKRYVDRCVNIAKIENEKVSEQMQIVKIENEKVSEQLQNIINTLDSQINRVYSLSQRYSNTIVEHLKQNTDVIVEDLKHYIDEIDSRINKDITRKIDLIYKIIKPDAVYE